METIDEFLAHYGIRGMKWGVRRKNAPSVSSPDATKAKEVAAVVKKHGTKAVSNKELQDLVTRMNLEQQYSSLSKKSQKKNPAAKFVTDVLVNVGKQQVSRIINDAATKQVSAYMVKAGAAKA